MEKRSVVAVAVVAFAWFACGPVTLDARSRQVPDTGLVQGRVRASEGAPIAGAFVEPRSLDRPRVRIPDVGNLSDDHGRYAWPLSAGTYTMSVSATGYRRATKAVTVRAGETTTLDFTLTRTR
jgi:Carboxypeptidase regulatory-like domain